jgi:hypothetical protein|tara:strand:- start:905 stop:1096 length:192 start_codon:yes stop_codon:yes gene_type:complete
MEGIMLKNKQISRVSMVSRVVSTNLYTCKLVDSNPENPTNPTINTQNDKVTSWVATFISSRES